MKLGFLTNALLGVCDGGIRVTTGLSSVNVARTDAKLLLPPLLCNTTLPDRGDHEPRNSFYTIQSVKNVPIPITHSQTLYEHQGIMPIGAQHRKNVKSDPQVKKKKKTRSAILQASDLVE